jgi:RNA polymerase sigma-70 factor (ECF subfamily)
LSDWLEEWAPRVYRFALRLTRQTHAAEDLTQETLLRAWGRHTQLRNASSARVWLFRIAVNLWRDQLRRRRSPVARAKELDEDCVQQQQSAPDIACARQEEVELARQALDQLPDRQRQVLYLHACEQMTLAEIADVCGISADAVKASLSVARKKVRELLKEAGPESASQR